MTNVKSHVAAAAIAAVCALPAAALAHAELVKSEPIADGVLMASAKEVTFTFNESVKPAMCKLTLDSKEVSSLGKPHADGTVLHIPIEKVLANGRYTLACRVVGPDSHPMNESISFVVSASSAK